MNRAQRYFNRASSLLFFFVVISPGLLRAAPDFREAKSHVPLQPIPGIPGQVGFPDSRVTPHLTTEFGTIRISGGQLTVRVTLSPFSLEVRRSEDDSLLLKSGRGPERQGFAPLAFTQNEGFTWNRFYGSGQNLAQDLW